MKKSRGRVEKYPIDVKNTLQCGLLNALPHCEVAGIDGLYNSSS